MKEEKIRKPPKALLITGDKFRDEIFKGERRTSIRRGRVDYKKYDTVLIGCPKQNWCIFRTIVNVKYKKLGEITPEEWGIEGFVATNETLRNLRKFFPGIRLESTVTLVTWNLSDVLFF